MTQLITVDHATLEQLVDVSIRLLKMNLITESEAPNYYAAITAGRAALANAEPANSYDLAKRADNGGQP